jgi:hypothetical protein
MTNVNNAFNAFNAYATAIDTSRVKLCAALKSAGYATYESVFEVATQWASKRTGCPLVQAERGDKVVLDKNHKGYEAAKTARRRVCEVFEQPERKVKQSGHAAKPVVTRAQKAAATAFLAEFEGDTLAQQIKAATALLRSLAA